MRFNHLLNNFSAGEWSPKARARSDAQEYMSACEELLNFIPQMQGGAFRRPGTVRITLESALHTDLQNAINATYPFEQRVKLIPRVLSTGAKQILFAFTGTQISTTWFVLTASDMTDDGAVVGFIGTVANTLTWYANAIQYEQTGDFVVMVSSYGDRAPMLWDAETYTTGRLLTIWRDYLQETAASSPNGLLAWKCFPYLPVQALDSSVTMTAGAASGNTTLTASAAFFDADHVGAYFKLSDGAVTGICRVLSWVSATVVNVTIPTAYPVSVAAHGGVANPDSSWEECAWSDYRGWPKTITAFQGRLYYGGNENQPDTIWASRIGNVFDMMERPFEQDDYFTGYTTDNSRPFTLTPNTKGASNIVALSSDKTLMIHTDKGEITAYGTTGALGPNDFMLDSSSAFGAIATQPIRADNYSLFVKKDGRRICELTFEDTQDRYKSRDLTFLSDHLTLDQNYNSADTTGGVGGTFYDPILEMCAVSGDNNLVVARTGNGRILFLTLNKEYKINAWSQCVLGGDGYQRDYPMVKAICSLSGNYGEGDRLYMVVDRMVNGSRVAHVECLAVTNEADQLIAATSVETFSRYTPAYVDGYRIGTTMDGLTWANFSNYIGDTLQVYADGNYIGEFTVNGSGNIVTTTVYTELSAGYKYTSRLKTMPIEIGQQVPGSPSGIIKRVDEAIIKFYLTRGAKYGHSVDKLYEIDFKDPTANMNAQPTLFTGLKRVHMPTDYARECQIIIEQDKPWPCNILGIISSGITYG